MIILCQQTLRVKFESGEQSMSSRALTSGIIKKIWLHNRQPAMANLTYPIPAAQRREARGGYLARVLMHAIITLGFVCLMRIDEVLSLRTEDIEERDDGGLQITLASRKSDPFGGKCSIAFHSKNQLFIRALLQEQNLLSFMLLIPMKNTFALSQLWPSG